MKNRIGAAVAAVLAALAGCGQMPQTPEGRRRPRNPVQGYSRVPATVAEHGPALRVYLRADTGPIAILSNPKTLI